MKKATMMLFTAVLVVGLFLPTVVSASPSPGIVGLWHLDEGTGLTANDASGNGNHGTLINMDTSTCWVDGMFGTALEFDGIDDCVMVPDSSTLDGMSVLTVEAWIYIDKDYSGISYAGIVDKTAGATSRSYNLGLRSGKLEWGVVNASNTKVYKRDTVVAPTGTWIYVVGTYDGATIRLYKNGAELTTGTALTGTVQDSSTHMAFGQWPGGGGKWFFDGIVDEVRIWDGALTSGEITYNYSLRDIAIDIKPGSDPNSINVGSHGVIPVAILSTADFDASNADPFSVQLAGAAVRLKGKSGNAGSLQDVDSDGDLDLVVQVYTEQLGLSPGAAEAELTGYTKDGLAFKGADTIHIVP